LLPLAFGAAWAGPARACNPAPPVPPILEGYEYDETARRLLLASSPGVALARFSKRLDLTIGDATSQPDYVFEVSEGWGRVAPYRLLIGGYWIDCDLDLRPGGHYLLYLEGERPLYILPAEDAAPEVQALGDLDWFYDQRGTLIRPELVKEVGDEGAGEDVAAEAPATDDIVGEEPPRDAAGEGE
jgi:hypothetical protein